MQDQTVFFGPQKEGTREGGGKRFTTAHADFLVQVMVSLPHKGTKVAKGIICFSLAFSEQAGSRSAQHVCREVVADLG